MAYLLVVQPGAVPLRIELRDSLRIGRDTQRNDVVLTDAEVSRQHARITAQDGGHLLVDTASTHGVRVNGARIQRRLLTDGDEVRIGGVVLRYTSARSLELALTPVAISTGTSGVRSSEITRQQRLVIGIGHALGAISDVSKLVGGLLELALAELSVERGLIALADWGSALRVMAQAPERPGVGDEIVLPGELVEAVLGRGERVLQVEDMAIDRGRSTTPRPPVMAVAVPILAQGRPVGLLYAESRGIRRRFEIADAELLATFATVVEEALQQARHHDELRGISLLARESNLIDLPLGASPAMQHARTLLTRLAREERTPVLVEGELGTGKRLFARNLHALSPRAEGPFVSVSCVGSSPERLEQQLFGRGGSGLQSGKVALARHGTLYLDEIAMLGASAQDRLVDEVCDREGGEMAARPGTHLVAGTRQRPHDLVAAGKLRPELCQLFLVNHIQLPPLRERAVDTPLLAQQFLARACGMSGRTLRGFTAEAIDALCVQPWPGNVRELEQVVERASLHATGDWIDAAALDVAPAATPTSAAPLRGLAERYARLAEEEREIVAEALRTTGGNISEAGRILGISRIMIQRRIARFGLDVGASDE